MSAFGLFGHVQLKNCKTEQHKPVHHVLSVSANYGVPRAVICVWQVWVWSYLGYSVLYIVKP